MSFFNPLVIHYAANIPVGRPERFDATNVAPATATPSAPAAKGGDINLANIVKLIPGDVIAIYLAAKGAVLDTTTVMGMKWPMFLALLCTLVCCLLRFLATRSRPEGANWWLVGVTGVAFLIWAHALYPSAPGPIISDFFGSIAGIVAMLFGLVAPKLVPAEPES